MLNRSSTFLRDLSISDQGSYSVLKNKNNQQDCLKSSLLINSNISLGKSFKKHEILSNFYLEGVRLVSSLNLSSRSISDNYLFFEKNKYLLSATMSNSENNNNKFSR